MIEPGEFEALISRIPGERPQGGLLEADLAEDPLEQLLRWFREAVEAGLPQPHAMALATASPQGRPAVRFVLLKGLDDRGLIFFTHHPSRKGRDLAENPHAEVCFLWSALHRQVRVAGDLARVSSAESQRYFASRPRGAQLSAWSSQQSEPIASREALEANLEQAQARFAAAEVPLPPHWGGYRLSPRSLEFWQGRENRLHDRLRYLRREAGGWTIERLQP